MGGSEGDIQELWDIVIPSQIQDSFHYYNQNIGMYNYYTNQKQSLHSDQQHKLEEERISKMHEQNKKEMIKNYIHRVVHGYDRVAEMNQQPAKTRDSCYQFRDFDNRKNIGPPSFYFKPRTEKERVTEAQTLNKVLDDVPFCSQSPHKFRLQKCNSSFKFTAYNSASRLMQSIQNMRTNEVPSCWNMNVREFLKEQQVNHHPVLLDNSNSNSHLHSLSHLNTPLHSHSMHHSDYNFQTMHDRGYTLYEGATTAGGEPDCFYGSGSGSVNNIKKKKKKKCTNKKQNCILAVLNLKRHPKSLESIRNKINVGVLKDAQFPSLVTKKALEQEEVHFAENKQVKLKTIVLRPIERKTNFR